MRCRPLAFPLMVLLAATALMAEPVAGPTASQSAGAALADDDDFDFDDDDFDDDDGFIGRSIPIPDFDDDVPRILRQVVPRIPGIPNFGRSRPRRQAVPAPPPPPAPPSEFVVTAASADDIDAIVALGYELVDRDRVDLIDAEVARLRIPDGTTLEAARAEVSEAVPAAVLDLNHLYRPGELACRDGGCEAYEMIGWKVPVGRCDLAPRIGMIDTSVNAEHAALNTGNVELVDILGEGREPASQIHGTAIAILIAGSGETRTPGLLPKAHLVAAQAFHRDARGEDAADVFDVVRGLSALVEREVEVINMSFTGPGNEVLRRAVEAALARGIPVVAAAGNAGPGAEPLYPAAYEGVAAVTAVDRRQRVYRQANSGAHITFAAPGVRLWTAASISGGRFRSGTSYAAPFVTAALAAERAGAEGSDVREVVEVLAGRAIDLGDPGRDDVFGWGLVLAEGPCAQTRTAGESR